MLANPRSYLSSFAVVVASATIVLVAVAGGAVGYFGNVPRAWAYVRGESILAEPSTIDVGEVAPRSAVARAVSLTNLTSRSIRILGGNTTCDFGLAESLPMDIGPGKSRAINLVFMSGPQAGDLGYTYLLVLDGRDRPIRVSVTGKVVARQSAEPPLAGD